MQDEHFNIEEATPNDIPRLVDMINGCYRGERSRTGWTTEADLIAGDIRIDEAGLAKILATENVWILKFSYPSTGIVGSVYLEKKGDRLYLGMFSVDVTQQANGIGKLLLYAAEAHARSLSCRAVFMQVIHQRHELIGWYERQGYRQTGERKPFDGDPNLGVPKMPLEFLVLEKVFDQKQ